MLQIKLKLGTSLILCFKAKELDLVLHDPNLTLSFLSYVLTYPNCLLYFLNLSLEIIGALLRCCLVSSSIWFTSNMTSCNNLIYVLLPFTLSCVIILSTPVSVISFLVVEKVDFFSKVRIKPVTPHAFIS